MQNPTQGEVVVVETPFPNWLAATFHHSSPQSIRPMDESTENKQNQVLDREAAWLRCLLRKETLKLQQFSYQERDEIVHHEAAWLRRLLRKKKLDVLRTEKLRAVVNIKNQNVARKQKQRNDYEKRSVEQARNTTLHAIKRTRIEVRNQRHILEQAHDTAAHVKARQYNPKFYPMACTIDSATGERKFHQPCGVWNKPCTHGCGYMHLSNSSPGTLKRCCANGKLSPYTTANMESLLEYELDEMPSFMFQCMESDESFSHDSTTYNNLLSMGATRVCNYSTISGWTRRGPGPAAVTLNGRVHHYFKTADSTDPSCGLSYFIFDDVAAQTTSATSQNVNPSILTTLGEGLKRNNPYCRDLRYLGMEARVRAHRTELGTSMVNLIPSMPHHRNEHIDICSIINSRQNNHLKLTVQAIDGTHLDDIQRIASMWNRYAFHFFYLVGMVAGQSV